MTLSELGKELRKLYKFNYLVVENIDGKPESETFWLYEHKPVFETSPSLWHSSTGESIGMFTSSLATRLDLFEYRDEDGNIDYSKCIVEVSE